MVQRAIRASIPHILLCGDFRLESVLLGRAYVEDHGDPELCVYLCDQG